MVLYPSGFPLVSFPVWVLPTWNCLTVYPKKSKPTFPSEGINVCVTLVFFGLSTSPIFFSQAVIFCVALSNSSFSGCKITKSSAYRTKIGFISLYFIPSVIAFSIPCKAILASNGEITPPCGVPASVGANTSLSITPALSHALMIRLICGNVLSFFKSSSWSIASNDPTTQYPIQQPK